MQKRVIKLFTNFEREEEWLNRVGGCPLIEQPTSHTTGHTVRYPAVPKLTL